MKTAEFNYWLLLSLANCSKFFWLWRHYFDVICS